MNSFLTVLKKPLPTKALLVMKITTAFILLFTLNVSARGFGQDKISLQANSTQISGVLRTIEKQTSYRFLYNDRLAGIREKITINVKDASLSDVLTMVFQNTALTFQMMDNNLVVIREANRPAVTMADITIQGVVTGEGGAPVAGASVQIKGSTVGTTTNNDGRFSLTVPDGNVTLVISSVGYDEQEVAVGGRTDLSINMVTSTRVMEQVVVVGYGTARRKDLTGAVASIKGAEIARQPVQTATQAIQGRVAGVQIITSGQPNALPVVRVRGTGTMLGGANPLYVVDGVITDDIRNINSADIVTMDILKDASATAIYGMRAANGVLLITTKKGRAGQMVISYDATVGVREAAKLVDMAGPQQYAGYLNEASVYYGSGDPIIPGSALNGTNTDWYDEILRKGLWQNHNISLSGGSEKITYFLSAGFLNEEGIMLNNKFRRFTLRSNNEYRINKVLKFSTLISYTNSALNGVNLDNFNNAYRAAPYVPAKAGGLYGNTSLTNNVANPLLNLESVYDRNIGNRIQGTGIMEIKPVSSVTFRSSIGVDLDFNKSTVYNYAYENVGPNSVFITNGGNQLRGASNLRMGKNDANKWIWDNTVTFEKTYGLHRISALAGMTAEQFTFNSLVGFRDSVPASRDQWFLNASSSQSFSEGTGDKWTRNSYLSRINYSFNDRYLFTGTIRADGTSRFPTQNRWGYFPSVGLGWNIGNESFMDDQKIFSTLKLRGSFGLVGNDQIPTSSFIQLAGINAPYYYGDIFSSGISLDELVDKDLKWETTEEVDIGLDFGFMNNKLTGELDFYNKKTKDALVNVGIDAIFGDPNSIFITNAATFQNKGVELGLNWADNINSSVNYSIGANFAYNKNRILGLNGGQALFDGAVGNQGTTTKSDNGQPIGSFFVLEADGLFQTDEEATASGQAGAVAGDIRYVDQNKDGAITDVDRVYVGSYQPKLTYGINGSVNYQAFDLSINTYGTAGGKIYNGKKATRGADPRDNIEADIARDRWTVSNTGTDEPRARLETLPRSTYFVEKGDFFRINNLTVGYTLPKALTDRWKITNLRVYVTSQNLLTFTKYSGFTPELVSQDRANAGNPLNAGIELNAYPTTRTFAFGLNVGL